LNQSIRLGNRREVLDLNDIALRVPVVQWQFDSLAAHPSGRLLKLRTYGLHLMSTSAARP